MNLRSRPKSALISGVLFSAVLFAVASVMGCGKQTATPAVPTDSVIEPAAPTTPMQSELGSGRPDDEQDEPQRQHEPQRQDERQRVASPPSQPDPKALQQQAMLALGEGQDDRAYQLARQAMRLAPEDPQVVFVMALVLGNRKRYPEAIQMLDEVAQTSPEARLPALGQTAEWMVRFGQWSQAEERYRAILQELPDSNLVHRNLAELLLRQGRRAEAAEHLGFLCGVGDIGERELRTLLCINAPFSADTDQERLDPIGELAKARNDVGRGDLDAARKRLESLATLGGGEAALLGKLYVDLDDQTALSQWIETHRDIDDRFNEAWYARGHHAALAGDHAEAVRCFAECVLRNQTDAQAYVSLAGSLKVVNQAESAEEAERRAELIKLTQTIGAELAATTSRDGAKLSELIETLRQLNRPLEALAWQGIQLGYAQQAAAITDAQAEQIIAGIFAERKKILNENLGTATRRFILCGIDPDAIPGR